MRSLRSWALAVCLVIPVSGCRQGEGDRCEIDGDCQGSLTCQGSRCTSRPGTMMMMPPPSMDAGAEGRPEAIVRDVASDSAPDSTRD